MLAIDEHNMQAVGTTLEIVWRNPLSLVREQLKAREAVHSYYRWSEHARKIRAARQVERHSSLGSMSVTK